MTETPYTAIYYDGQSSQPHEALIEVFGNTLHIIYAGAKVVWAISEIRRSSFSGKHKTMLQYGAFPYQFLEFPDNSPLANTLADYLLKPDAKTGVMAGEYNAILKGALIILAIISIVLSVLYFVLLPALSSLVAEKIPVSTEVAMGEKLYENFIGSSTIDLAATKTLNEFAGNIDFETTYQLKFTVIENKEVNAFALPGGHVVVFSGILDRIKSSDELAALLTHEVTHIKERHSLKGLTRNLTGTLLVSLFFGDSGSLANVLISKAGDLYQLGFSRSMEKEADLEGLRIMSHNRINTKGMLRLMQRLQEEEKKYDVSRISSYLNSHPMTAERIAYIQENIPDNNALRNKTLEEIWGRMKMNDSSSQEPTTY